MPSKAPWENSFSVGKVMSAGNLEYSVMGVVSGGGLVQVPLLWWDGVGWERKLRVTLHAGGERANPALFPLG